jgi:CO dehydrogenase maturation factor
VRVAIAGKGGAGKTTTSATLARMLARSGKSVVAIDADSNPNLAVALGVDPEQAGLMASLPHAVVSRRLDGPLLSEPLEDVLERYTIAGPDGVRVALMGMPAHAEEGCMCSAHATVSAVLGELGTRADVATIVDMEASPEHLSRGTARHVDALLLVAEPYYRSLETVRRLALLAAELPIPEIAVVANKVRSPADAAAIAEFCARQGLEPVGEIPWSEAIVQADRRGIPLIDHAEDDEAVASIVSVSKYLLATTAASR